MGHCKSISWIIAFIFIFILTAIISFAVPSTSYRIFPSSSTGAVTLTSVFHQGQLSGLSPLSSFVIVWIRPIISNFASVSRTVDLTISSTFQCLSNHLQPFAEATEVNLTATTECTAKGCELVRVYEQHWVDFYALAFTATVESSGAFIEGFAFETTSHSQVLAIVAFVFISILTVVCAKMLFWVGFWRQRPSRPAHWAVLALAGAAFLLDGPWLFLKYYTSRVAAQIFDLAPPLFHVVFLVTVTFFIAERTTDFTGRIFASWIIRGLIAGGSLIVLVCEFVVASPMPLSTLSVYLRESALRFPAYVLSGVLQAGSVALLVFGIASLQIARVTVLALTAVIFGLVEAAFVARTYVRYFVPTTAIGLAFGADVFYTLLANAALGFLLLNGLPQAKARPGDGPSNMPELDGEVEPIDDDEGPA
jgi:hypothetical protein